MNKEEPVETPIQIDVIQGATIATVITTKPTHYGRVWFLQSYLVVATIVFGLLVILASSANYFPLDLSITRGVQSINFVGFDSLMWAVSVVGYSPQAFLLTAGIILILFLFGLRWEAVTALLAAGGVSSVGIVVKIIVHRPRPTADLVRVVQQFDSYSFPSGHVLFYTAFFGFLCFLTYKLLKPSWKRAVLLIILGSLVGLIGLSRIYLGEHWASDVTAAYLLGSLWLIICLYAYQWARPDFLPIIQRV